MIGFQHIYNEIQHRKNMVFIVKFIKEIGRISTYNEIHYENRVPTGTYNEIHYESTCIMKNICFSL